MATKIKYVFHGCISYRPADPITPAAEKNCAEKNASVVTSVNHPAMLVLPTQKLTEFRHFGVQREYAKWY